MGTKRKPIRNNDSISYTDLEQYGLGSWLKENAGVVGTVVGGGLGMAIGMPMLGATIGGTVGGNVQQNDAQSKAQEAQAAAINQQNVKTQAQEQLQNMQRVNPNQTYMPVAKCGGRLKRYIKGGDLEIPVKTTTSTIPSPTRMDSSTRTDGYSLMNTSEKFIQKPEPFILDPKDVVSKMEGQYWRSNSGYTPKGMEPYFHVARGKERFVLTPKEYEIAKGFQNKPQYAMGGTLNYGGQLHEGPDGGNPVDGKGNINLNNPTALVQKGEVGYNTEDGSTYIFSDDLYLDKKRTFANEAKKIQSKYSRRLGKNMIEKHDALASKGYNMDMKQLLDKQEQVREINGVADNMEKLFGGAVEENQLAEQMKKGGWIKEASESIKRRGTEGKCTPITKPGCTGRAKALAKTFKKIAKNREMGGNLPEYANGDLLPITPNTNYQIPNPMELPTASQIRTDLQPSTAAPITEGQWKPDTGMDWQSAASLAAPIAGAITNRLTRRKPKKTKLDESGATPQGISLERERAVDREQANLARANIKRALKSGTSAQGYMANVAAAETGVQRELGQQLGESYQKEEAYNSGLSQQEAARADQRKQTKLQADLYNTSLESQYDVQKQGDITGIINALNMYGRDVLQSKRDMNYLQMMDPRYRVMARRRKWFSPKEQKVQINPDNIIG